MSSVDEFKAAGNAAFSSGNMTKAIEQFTLAISLGTTDNSSKDVMKVLYSNRSAAYHKLAKFDDALNDAKKCVSLDGQWAKGHSRAGAAYYSLRKWTDAYNSYNAVLRIDANDSNATEMRDKAMNCIANANASSNSYNSSSSSQPPVSGLLGSIRTYSQYTTLIAFIAYLIPLGTISRIAYKAVALSSIASTGITLFSSLGMPKFTADYAQRLMISPGGTTLFLSILVLASRAYVLAAIPLILPIASDCLVTYIRKVIPPGAAFDTSSLPAMVRPYVANYLPQMQQVMSELSTPGGTRRITDAAEKMAAKCEIYQGIFLVIELVLPTRNFMLIYLWCVISPCPLYRPHALTDLNLLSTL